MNFSKELIKTLREAQRIAVLTGAGISAESGIPTFREAQTGLWAQYDPEELATPRAFSTNPELVWSWYKWRQEIVSQSEPNPGHLALAQMESTLSQHDAKMILITQNVDGLHRRAGSKNIIELHGNINRSKCFDCGKIATDDTLVEGKIPHCDRCDGFLRPDVVWFGESLPQEALQTAWAAAESCDVFLSIGTSALVQPAASLPVVALQKGATVIEINPNATQITILVAHHLQGPAGEILPKLVAAVWPA